MEKAAVVTSEPAHVVRVSGLWKRYRNTFAVRGVDLEVRAGELYGLIGPDGAGKSSVMKTIAGVLAHDAGQVEVFGTKITSERSAERIKDRIGFMPQGLGLNLYPELSVEENVDFFARLRLVPRDQLAERKRRLLGITRLDRFPHRPMKELSGGMKQKLALVCTLIHMPRLVILDEPTTGVDPVSRRDFWAILAEFLGETGMTALVSTAYMDEAARFTSLSVFSEGRIVAQGAPDELLGMVSGTMLAIHVEDLLGALAHLKRHFGQVHVVGSEIRVFLPDTEPEQARTRIEQKLAAFPTSDVRFIDPDLEDVLVAVLPPQPSRQEPALETSPLAPVQHKSEVAIEADGLVRMFGDFCAVAGVSFRVRSGEIFGLLGPNGAGKTTVIKMLTGLIKPSAGQGSVAGVDMRRARRAIRERIGYMSQAFSLYLDLTVIENIRLYGGVYGLSRRHVDARLDWIVNMAGLHGYEDQRTSGLPVGVRQRLALGCALIHRPRVLFLDEPTSGVDVIGRRYFWQILLVLARNEGVAILVTTHYMSESEHCDQLALMHGGRIVAAGSSAEMKADAQREAGQPLAVSTDRPSAALAALAKAGFGNANVYGHHIHLLSRQPEKDRLYMARALADANVNVLSISPRSLTMEDLFVYWVTQMEQQAAPTAP